MRLLLDACVWGGAADELRMNGHDVIWAGDWDIDPGDEEILARAHAEGRILITLDKDFGELAVVRRSPHCGILRIAGFPARKQAGVITDPSQSVKRRVTGSLMIFNILVFAHAEVHYSSGLTLPFPSAYSVLSNVAATRKGSQSVFAETTSRVAISFSG
jgi:predicted nuclease of predicted toxin-antitoxin system